MAHASTREHRMRRLLHRRAVLRIDQPAAGQPADIVGRHVFAGEHRDDTRCGCRGGGIDAGDPGMRMRAAQNVGVDLAGRLMSSV